MTIKTSHCFTHSCNILMHGTSKSQHICRILKAFFFPSSFSGYSSCLDTVSGVLSGLKDYLVSSGPQVPKLSPVKLSCAEFQQIQQASPACRICLEPLITNIPTEMLSNTVVSPFPTTEKILLKYNTEIYPSSHLSPFTFLSEQTPL